MKKNKKKMCAWLITMALGLAIVGCSNKKTTTTQKQQCSRVKLLQPILQV